MNQTTIDEKVFPNITQRKTLAATDAELLAILRRLASADGFVGSDVSLWSRRLHAWPEVASQEAREDFVRERIETFVRFGLLRRAEKLVAGQRVRGFVFAGRKKNSFQDDLTAPRLTPNDRRFLQRLKIGW